MNTGKEGMAQYPAQVGFQPSAYGQPPAASAPMYGGSYPAQQAPAYGEGMPYPNQTAPAYGVPMYPPPPHDSGIPPGMQMAPPPPPYGAPKYNDPPYADQPNPEYQQPIMDDWTGFADKAIRKAFVKKVYSILMLQLSFTVGVVALFLFEKRVKYFVQRNIGVYIASYIAFLVLYFVLICFKSIRRKHPHNIILLGLFTLCMSYMVGTISSFHDTNIVIMALGICAASCLVITIFAMFTKFDFTTCGGVLLILSCVLFMFGILAIFTYSNILRTVYAALGALVFMLFLAYDTQMIMGGKKYELSPEEYISAALQLYLDVVYIFLFILALMGGGKK